MATTDQSPAPDAETTSDGGIGEVRQYSPILFPSFFKIIEPCGPRVIISISNKRK